MLVCAVRDSVELETMSRGLRVCQSKRRVAWRKKLGRDADQTKKRRSRASKERMNERVVDLVGRAEQSEEQGSIRKGRSQPET